jgi:hypothetical protein
MAELTVYPITKESIRLGGANLVSADNGGDTVPVASDLIFYVDNSLGAGVKTVTVAAPIASKNCVGYGEVAIEDMEVVVGVASEKAFRVPLGYADDGKITITYTGVNNLFVGVFSISP